MTSESAELRRLRQRAFAQGLILRKLAERDRWYAQYGPYMLVDASSNGIVASGLSDLEAVTSALDETEPQSEQWQRGEHPQ